MKPRGRDGYNNAPHACVGCGYTLEEENMQIFERPGEPPKPGDFSICFNCGQLMIFDEWLRERKLFASEIREAIANRSDWHDIEKTQNLIRARGPYYAPWLLK